MKQPLISFQVAKLAKEKGFNIPCNKMFTYGKELFGYVDIVKEFDGDKYECAKIPHDWNNTEQPTSTKYFSRPTQSALQRWLREVHGIHIQIIYERGFWMYSLYKLPSEKDKQFAASGECQDGDLWLDADHLNKKDWYMQEYKSYEEALEASLLESLKLIK